MFEEEVGETMSDTTCDESIQSCDMELSTTPEIIQTEEAEGITEDLNALTISEADVKATESISVTCINPKALLDLVQATQNVQRADQIVIERHQDFMLRN